jgi:hypothetical protein
MVRNQIWKLGYNAVLYSFFDTIIIGGCNSGDDNDNNNNNKLQLSIDVAFIDIPAGSFYIGGSQAEEGRGNEWPLHP